MPAKSDSPTSVERLERAFVVTRTFKAPVHIVWDAWTNAELFKRWWAPKSLGWPLQSCEMDVRTGGGYRLEFGHTATETMAFFGKYLEVVPHTRLVWTNDEGEDAAVTTVTFEAVTSEEGGDTTLLVLRETYASKEALEKGAGAEEGLPEQFLQLDELLDALRTGAA